MLFTRLTHKIHKIHKLDKHLKVDKDNDLNCWCNLVYVGYSLWKET